MREEVTLHQGLVCVCVGESVYMHMSGATGETLKLKLGTPEPPFGQPRQLENTLDHLRLQDLQASALRSDCLVF